MVRWYARIKKLEVALQPKTPIPACIVAYSHEEAAAKKREFREKYGEEQPLIIAIVTLVAPANSGLGE